MTEETKAIDVNELIAQRKIKLCELRERGVAFPNDFRRDVMSGELHAHYGDKDNEFLEKEKIHVKIAGRIMLCRIMGKASFIQLQDMSGRIQCYLRKNELGEKVYDEFKKWDLGDIVGIEGFLFKTKTGELTVHAESARLLTKALRPLPDKFHGLADRERRYRQRYLDLIANETSREVFKIRSKILEGMRHFLNQRGFLEVETPMMQVMPGGALAKPFVTHHNALDMALYLRIAPELYLKRLVVGGFERVYEINRNFRNEGLSLHHNPEFTMLEFYQAYADYHDLIDLTESMIKTLAKDILGTQMIHYQGNDYDLAKPFHRIPLRDAVLQYNPKLTQEDMEDKAKLSAYAVDLGVEVKPTYGLGKIQMEIFEKTVECNLREPTFITEYPAEVSPLARRNNKNPFITDRFEIFIAGYEVGNGFSELNDPEDQAERFRAQVAEKELGDEEAMHFDEDYIVALEHGMPPTAGEGIGIDRLVMLFTDSASIRDVLLFPHMRPIV
ncbi:MAG: lysine--tRNA ligase [Gammaproteobacteria bacterium]|jgi:lysyl-tRNA synthetase class 2